MQSVELQFDTTNMPGSQSVGAYLRDSLGQLITSTAVTGGHQAIDVNVVQSVGSSSGTTDNSAFTVSVSSFQPDGGVYNDSLAALTSGQEAMARYTAYRGQHINLRTNAGVEIGSASGAPLFVSAAVSNFPATQPVSGTVSLGAGAAAIGSVSVSNFPTSQVAYGTYNSTAPTLTTGNSASLQLDVNGNLKVVPQGTQTVSGSVSVSNFPATQAVSGTVSLGAGAAAIGSVTVSNFPATQPVSGTVSLGAGAAAIGSVTVSNFPATQAVSGSVTVSGSVSVSNFPATQPVSGTVAATQSGSWTSAIVQPTVATLTQPTVSTSSFTALAANTSRKGFIMSNNTNQIIYLAFAATASATAYTYKVLPGNTIEKEGAAYTGLISAIAAATATGVLAVTDLA